MTKIAIINGRVIDPANRLEDELNVYIKQGKIVAIAKTLNNFKADQVIDATGLIVCPGLIDLNANIYPVSQNMTALENQLEAAARAGITTLCTTLYPSKETDPIMMEWLQNRADRIGKTKLLQLGSLIQSDENAKINVLASLKNVGAIGVTNGITSIQNTQLKRRCYEYAAMLGLKVFIFPNDAWLSQDGCMHEGEVSFRLGLTGIPTMAETVAINQEIPLIEETGIHAHFCRLSSAKGVELIAEAQRRLPITADVSAHQLHLTEVDVYNYNSQCHVIPPLRTETDRKGLIRGLKNNIITAVCSDHTPLPTQAKLVPFHETKPGISALETLLPLSLRLNDEGHSLSEIIARMTMHPAAILGIDAGNLKIGANADICIFDPKKQWTLTKDQILSQFYNTPFLNWDFQGKVQYTLIDGKVI